MTKIKHFRVEEIKNQKLHEAQKQRQEVALKQVKNQIIRLEIVLNYIYYILTDSCIKCCKITSKEKATKVRKEENQLFKSD